MTTAEEFIEYFRSDRYSEELKDYYKKELFLSSLAGSSDITSELIEELVCQYSAGSPFPLWIGGYQVEECLCMYRNGDKLNAVKKLVELGKEEASKVSIKWADDYLKNNI